MAIQAPTIITGGGGGGYQPGTQAPKGPDTFDQITTVTSNPLAQMLVSLIPYAGPWIAAGLQTNNALNSARHQKIDETAQNAAKLAQMAGASGGGQSNAATPTTIQATPIGGPTQNSDQAPSAMASFLASMGRGRSNQGGLA